MHRRAAERVERRLHPAAWWIWSIALATAASRTANPLILLLLCAVVGLVVAARRSDEPWARGFRVYLILGILVVTVRIVFRVVIGGDFGTTTLVRLPAVRLPQAAAGITLGGPVTLEEILAAVYDGLRIATLLICLGAANSLADAKRLLKVLPSALYEMGVAVTIALTVAPQLIESGQRINRARTLRAGRQPGFARGVLIPVLDDALARSLVVAAAMDSRGYGRRGDVTRGQRRFTGGLLIAGVVGLTMGTYGLLDGTTPTWIGAPMLGAGVVVAIVGLRVSGRRVQRSAYRPDAWRIEEWGVVGAGVGAAVLMFIASEIDPAGLSPSLEPPEWPSVGWIPALAATLGAAAMLIAPPTPSVIGPSGATQVDERSVRAR